MAHQPLKVLITADTIGGVWTYTLELLRALASYRCEFLLATLGIPLSSSQRREVAQLANVHVAESAYKLEWMDEPWAHVDASGAWLMELARNFRPDLVHLNTFVHGALPWQVPVLVVGHSCVLSWWQAVKGCAAPPTWATYQRRVAEGLAHADVVVAPTQAMLDDLNLYYGPFRASQVIYNARRLADYAPRAKENFIFTMGRAWDEAKNIAILNRIAPKLPWPIYVAGEQMHPNGGEVNLVNLRSLGYLSPAEVREWLARASIFALPARYEPFGLAALEAALSGCALVLGDIPSLREVWEDNALFVPPDQHATLLRCLTRLIDESEQRTHFAESAGRHAQRYTPERMGRAYWQLYQQLILESSLRHQPSSLAQLAVSTQQRSHFSEQAGTIH